MDERRRPLAFEANAHDAGPVLPEPLTYDPVRRTLSYTVTASGVTPARVYSISIDRDSAGKKGPVLEVLTAPGESRTAGSLELNAAERADLAAGRLSLVLYTADAPLGTIRGALVRR